MGQHMLRPAMHSALLNSVGRDTEQSQTQHRHHHRSFQRRGYPPTVTGHTRCKRQMGDHQPSDRIDGVVKRVDAVEHVLTEIPLTDDERAAVDEGPTIGDDGDR
jgi:hypothetical protein